MRRYGNPPSSDVVYQDRPGAYAIIITASGRVLITLQTTPILDWQLPGGGIDQGESPQQALHREVMEETGWRICVERRLGCYQHYCYMPDYDRYARKICHIYLARGIHQVAPSSEPDHQSMLLPPESALQLLGSPGQKAYLEGLDLV